MSTDALKDKARKFELKEDWNKALDLYLQAIGQEEGSEQPDIGLFNRVGDLQTRIGNNEAAVDHYERAVDLYVEADLANNAIAICKKVIRNLPGRASIYRKMGQIRAAQGFLTDARQNFLTFAEIKQAEGDLEETFNALIEFVELAPEDIEIRLALAGQMETHEREEEAVEQLTEAYRLLITNDRDEEAEAVRERLGELDPTAVLPDSDTIRTAAAAAGPTTGARSGGLGGLEFAYTTHVDDDEEEESVDMAEDLGEIEVGAEEEEEVAEVGGLEDFEIAAETEEEEEEEEEADALPMIEFDDEEEEEEEVAPLPMMEFDEEEEEAEELPTIEFDEVEEEEAEELPTIELDAVEEEEEEAAPLPLMEFDEEEEEEEEEEELVAVAAEGDGGELDAAAFGEADDEVHGSSEYVEDTEPLPELEVDVDLSVGGEEVEEEVEVVAEVEEVREEALEEVAFEEAAEEEEVVVVAAAGEAVEVSDHEAAAEAGDFDKAIELIRREVAHDPNNIDLRQRLVEYAFRKNDDRVLMDAYLELADCLLRTGSPAKAQAVFQQVLSAHPDNEKAQAALAELEGKPTGPARAQVTTSEEYVDLGSMILDDEEEDTTRWVVAAEAPTGDDEADFANMLAQFKQKVSEHVAADDVSAHHDLGTAYMEMGLLDEAVAEFQQALRAAADHLPTYEVLGRCFIEKGDYEIAVKSLSRALEAPYEVEDELIGIYYHLGKAHEELGNKDEAVEFFEKVFSLDINFEDVTERLRALR